MLKSDVCIDEEDIAPLIKVLSDTLCLRHWHIGHKLETDSKMGESLMKVVPNRQRNLATIFIRESLIGRPTYEFGPLVLHELLHLVLDPIVEEHTFQLQYEVSDVRLKEYQKRFIRPLERVIDHLTTHLAPLIIFTVKIEETTNKIQLMESASQRFYDVVQTNRTLLLDIYEALAQNQHPIEKQQALE